MAPKLPQCCSPVAFNLLARHIDDLETSDALVYGAIAVAAHEMEAVNPREIDAALQRYADTVRSRVHGEQPQALLAHLHELLFEEEHFRGNTDNYYDPTNSYLPAVMKNKTGLPILLSLVYKTVAQRAGLRAWGVGLPGHFIAAVEIDGTPLLIDPFAGGRLLTAGEAHQKICEIFGPEVEWADELLEPVSNRIWLTRMLQNLLTAFGGKGRYADVAAVLEMEMLLWPDQDRLQRDLALVLARVGLIQPAAVWLHRYLDNHPDDPQKSDLTQLLQVLDA